MQTQNRSFYIALGQNSIRRRNRNWLRASAKTLFVTNVSFYGWIFLLWSLHTGYFVIGNFCYIFSPLLLSHCYRQVAIIFTFISSFSVKLLFRRRYWGIFYLNLLLRYTLSDYLTGQYTILIHYLIILHLNTLPNPTLSYYITDLTFHRELDKNSIYGCHSWPQAWNYIRTCGGQRQLYQKFSWEKPIFSNKSSLIVPELSQ